MSANQNQSQNQQKPHKMCKSPPKSVSSFQSKQQPPKTAKGLDLANYEVLNTNCTMVGSNNLNLESKLTYPTAQVKVCAKPLKSPVDSQNLLKKPQSPRAAPMDPYGHSALQGVAKYSNTGAGANFGQIRGLQPSPTSALASPSGFSKSFDSLQASGQPLGLQQAVRVSKAPSVNFSSVQGIQGITSSPVNVVPSLPVAPSLNNGAGMCSMSPSAYSNPSPSYPNNAVSPYNVQISSPANSVSSINSGVAGIKSPVASPQNIRPPTPQPILPQAFPVMTSGPNLVQIIHAPNSASTYQNHPVITRQTIIAPPTQNIQNTSPIIKIKPPQNILPKPPPSGTVPAVNNKQTTTRTAVSNQVQASQQIHQNTASSAAQIVLPNQAILPTAQPGTLVLNQMPLIVQQNTAHGVQLILRPSTPNSAPQLATSKLGAPQNLILQQGPAPNPATPQVLIQHAGTQRQTTIQQPQQLVRVLTANGMIQPIAPTYIAMNNQQLNIQQLSQPQQPTQQQQQQPNKPQLVATSGLQQSLLGATCLPPPPQNTSVIEQLPPPKKKPKKKKKNKEPKLDLANIMKLSGIGDEDDVLFEPDTSEPAVSSEANHTTPSALKVLKSEPQSSAPTTSDSDLSFPKRIGNIHITGITQENGPKPSSTITPASRTDSIHHEKTLSTFTQSQIGPSQIGQSQISVQQSLSDINAINQNLAQIGLINQGQNFIGNSQILSQINAVNTGGPNISISQPSQGVLNPEGQNLASFLQALNHGQNYSLLNGQNLQNITVSQSAQPGTVPASSVPGLSFPPNSQGSLPISTYQKFPGLPTQSSGPSFAPNIMSGIVTASSMAQQSLAAQNLTPETVLSNLSTLPKSQPSNSFTQAPKPQTNSLVSQATIQGQNLANLGQNLTNAHFNLAPGALQNIQVQNFCSSNPNLILNQGANAILTPNIPNFSGNITINNSLIPNANLTLPNNLVPNFLPTNLVQPATEVNPGFPNSNLQRTGGFKLALSEDGRLILQHDPNLNQDIQSQLLLQSIFGINLQGGNLVLTSVNNPTVPQPPKPVTVTEPPKKPQEIINNTKTTSIIQNAIPSVKTSEPTHPTVNHDPVNSTSSTNPPNNFSYIVNLTPEQLETLKRNGQLTVNGQTIFMHRPGQQKTLDGDRSIKSSPKGKTSKKKGPQFENKSAKTVLQEHLSVKSQQSHQNSADSQNLGQNVGQNVGTAPQIINRAHNQVSQSVQTGLNPAQVLNSVGQNIVNLTQLQGGSKVLMGPQNSSGQVVISAMNSGSSADGKSAMARENVICVQSGGKNNAQKLDKSHQISNSQQQIIAQHLLSQKNMLKQTPTGEQLIILQQQNVEKSTVSLAQSTADKKVLISGQDLSKSDADLFSSAAVQTQNAPEKSSQINGVESPSLNSALAPPLTSVLNTSLATPLSSALNAPLPTPLSSALSAPSHNSANLNAGSLNVSTLNTPTLNTSTLNTSAVNTSVLNTTLNSSALNAAALNAATLNASSSLNVEQFLSNLNINPANLGQLISQKLSQELPSGVDHKIVNIAPGPTAGHIVAKIDISSENMQQILSSNSMENSQANGPSGEAGSLVLPPLISMNVKAENDVFTGQVPSESGQSQQLPALIIGGNVLPPAGEIQANSAPTSTGDSTNRPTSNNTVYQRIQTIQLTPQKQQLLKSVQLQIQALTARLQQKSADSAKTSADGKSDAVISEPEIHTALRHLFIEQQKILATGKVIPTINQSITNISCNTETVSTQSVPVTTASKTNGTFLTSLLHQPVVSHNQAQKVYYHHGNQIIAISPTSWPNQNILPTPNPVVTPSAPTNPPGGPNCSSSGQIALKIKKMTPGQATSTSSATFLTPAKLPQVSGVERNLQVSPQHPGPEAKPPIAAGSSSLMSPTKRMAKPTYSKAQLIEQQLATDQNGAMNPDITTPFSSKADACKRLVRYHCYNQPVLSQKDLNKADEIFELTARHFIEKFKMMVHKYKYLLFKESMREVQTSELMMIDRMFLAEEQQSFLKLQSDVKLQNELELQESVDMYKKEPDPTDISTFENDVKPGHCDFAPEDFIKGFEEKPPDFPEKFEQRREAFTVKTERCDPKTERYNPKAEPYDPKAERYEEGNADFNIKCGLNYFSDESCESGNFRVYEDSPKEFDNFIGKSDCFTADKTREKDKTKSGMESYNTTKIIGNFEIEINNKGCNSQESYTKNFRQKIIDNKVERKKSEDSFLEKEEDYDEWLCIQRELGYFPPENKLEADQKAAEGSGEQVGSGAEGKGGKLDGELFKKAHKRSSSDSSRLETLKKFRVEKHNSKVKKTGSIIGEVKFEVRIEHKKVFAEQNKSSKPEDHPKASSINSLKRPPQGFDYKNLESSDYSKRVCVSQQNFTPSCTSCQHTIKQEESPLEEHPEAGEDGADSFDTSIDEQVQSAIDSILNLQQITSMSSMSSVSSMSMERNDAAATTTTATMQQEAAKMQAVCKSKTDNELAYGSKTLNEDFCDPSDTLDEAVKSILS